MNEIILRAGADSYVANPFVSSLVEQINESHGSICINEDRFKQVTLDTANRAREAGLFLLELKAKLPHGTWLTMFATSHGKTNETPVLHFDSMTARRYMSVAKKYSDGPITRLPDAVRTMRELYADAAGRLGTTAKAIPSITMIFEAIMSRAQSKFHKFLEESPLENWSPELRQGMKRIFEPAVAIYNRL